MKTSSKAVPVEQIYQQQLEAAIALARVLDLEAEAIKNRDAEALTELAPEKIAGLKQLEALEQSRLQQHTESENSLPVTSPFAGGHLREKMLRMVGVCQRKNQLNGVMLQLRQEHIQRAMDLIADRDSAAITYMPDGTTKLASGKSNTSVSA